MQSRLGWKAHNICTVEESGPVFIRPPCKPTLYIVLCNFRRFRNLLQFGKICCSTDWIDKMASPLWFIPHTPIGSPPQTLLLQLCRTSFQTSPAPMPVPPPGLQYGTATGRGQVRGQRSLRLYDELISHAACRRSSPSDRACSPTYQHLVCITWPHMLVYRTTLAAWRSG